MAERGNIILFPLDRVRRISPFSNKTPPGRENLPMNSSEPFVYHYVCIPPDSLFDDERIVIDGVSFSEYIETQERDLLEYPSAFPRFLDGTQARVFDARCAFILERKGGEQELFRDLARFTLNKADAMETADHLRHSVKNMLETVFGKEEAREMLKQIMLGQHALEGQIGTPNNKHSHLRIVD